MSCDKKSTASTPGGTSGPRTPDRPKPPILYGRTLSMDPSICSALSNDEWREEKPQYDQSLKSPSVVLKWLQLGVTLLCISLYSDSSHILDHNAAAVNFHFIAYSACGIITGVILLSYIIGMKMREVLMRLFNIISGIMFLASTLMLLEIAIKLWPSWEDSIQEFHILEEIEISNEGSKAMVFSRRRVKIVLQIIFCFINFVFYLCDVAYSIWRTLTLL